MKNNKGFTLIELLVTIALMLSLLAIAIVSFINLSDRKKNEAYNDVKDQVVTAAEQYFSSNAYYLESLPEKGTVVINVAELVKSDYLNVVNDPRTGKKLNSCYEVVGTKTNGSINYVFNEKLTVCHDNPSIIVKEPGAPEIKVTVNGKIGDHDWYISDVNVVIEAIPNGNGAISEILKGNNVIAKNSNTYTDVFSTDGNYGTITYKAKNISGKTAMKTITIKLDKTAPTCTTSINTTVKSKIGNTYWFNSGKPAITFSSSDTTSGIENAYKGNGNKDSNCSGSSCTITESITPNSSGKYERYFVDNAGNRSKTCGNYYGHDSKGPACSVTASGKAKNEGNVYVANYDGWYTGNVNVSLSANDSGSGVKYKTLYLSNDQLFNTLIPKNIQNTSATVNYDLNSTGFYGYVEDNLGNWSSCGVIVKRDSIAPVISSAIYGNQNYTNPTTGNKYLAYVDVVGSDNLSGVAGFSYRHCYNGSSTKSWYCNAKSIYNRDYSSALSTSRLNLRDTASVKFQFRLYDNAGNFTETSPQDFWNQ